MVSLILSFLLISSLFYFPYSSKEVKYKHYVPTLTLSIIFVNQGRLIYQYCFLRWEDATYSPRYFKTFPFLFSSLFEHGLFDLKHTKKTYHDSDFPNYPSRCNHHVSYFVSYYDMKYFQRKTGSNIFKHTRATKLQLLFLLCLQKPGE